MLRFTDKKAETPEFRIGQQDAGELDFGKFLNPPKKPGWRSGRLTGNTKPDPGQDLDGLVASWQQDPTNRQVTDKLLRAASPMLDRIVAGTGQSGNPVQLGRAKLLFMKALPRYDGRASIQTFAHTQLRPLIREQASQQSAVRVSREAGQIRRKIGMVEEQFIDQHGRAPSMAELADQTGYSIKQLQRVRSSNLPGVAESRIGTEPDGYQASDQAVEQDDNMWLQTVYYGLNPVNQFIMESTMGLNGQRVLSNQEIARKLKISPAAVSQRKASIQKMLDQ
jgi:DNA-directed RNA polymerase specialized sigma subunit